MLTVKKELDLNDFINDYDFLISSWDFEAKEITFEALCEAMDGYDEISIRDYIRFQLEIMTQSEVIENYSIFTDDELQEMDEDERHVAVGNYLSDNTYLLGSYKDNNGVMVYLFEEF